MILHICGECGIEFGMPNLYYENRQETGKAFYCPNGHCRVFRPSDLDQERMLRQKAETRAADAERNLEAERRNHRAEIKRMQKKANQPIVRLLPASGTLRQRK